MSKNKFVLDKVDESVKSGISLDEMESPCHYHASTEFIDWQRVLPEGMNPSLQYVLYPYLLAMTYGGNIPAQPYICPTSEGSEFIFIKRTPPDLIERVKNLIKTLLLPIRPMGRVKMMPEVEVGGKSFPFDLGNGGTVCPAAFRSFFPFLARSHLLPVKDTATPAWRVCCPDHSKNLLNCISCRSIGDIERALLLRFTSLDNVKMVFRYIAG